MSGYKEEEHEEEYEVESIMEARTEVDQGPRNKPRLIWKFRVRWKGYKAEDDTWESIKSFDGSESLIAEFWEQTFTQGRDIHDLTLFQLGENFFQGMKKETES